MKRRLITVMILLFASFIMASCDFGGNNDTTTETPTTEQPTTVAPTTAPPTSAGEVSYTVTFYDGDGSVMATQTVSEGGSATSPGTPTKAATAQYTYTFDEWSLSYTNVLGDMNIYPVFTETLNTYTVTFYDGDGTVLETQTITYGSGATTPAQTPVKADEGVDQFVFASWDLDFSNVTGDLTINPVFTTQFNRSVLLLMVETMFISEPNFGEEPEDPEEVLDEIMEIMGSSDEEAMYYQLVDIWEMYEEIFSIRTGTELQDWYAATKTAGFDKTFYTTTLYNAMINGITNDFNNYTDEVAELTLTLAEDTTELAIMNSNIASLEAEAASYCSIGVDSSLTTDCEDYWDQLNERLQREIAYYEELDFVVTENSWDFDWSTYNNLLNIQEQLTYHMVVTENQTEIDNYEQMLDDELSYLYFDEYNMYYPLLQSFEYYKSMEFDLYQSNNYSHLEVDDLAGTYTIKYHLLDLFNGNSVDYPNTDYHYYGLSYYILEKTYLESHLEETTWYLEEMEEKLEETIVLYTLVTDPTYEQNFLDLFGTAYDMLDAVVLTVDDAAFDMVFDLGMDVLLPSLFLGMDDSVYYGDQADFVVSQSSGMMMSTMLLELVTAENIEMVADRLNITISAVYGTLDQTDFNNAKTLLFAFLEAQMLAEGMDQVDVDAMILEYSTMYDEYVLYFNAFVPEVTSLLGSIDSTKAEALEMIINQDFGVMTDIDVAVLVAQGLEVLIGDDSFDISIPLKILANIYIDQSELDLTPTEITQIEADIDTYVTDLLALVATVSEYDSHFLTAAEVEDVMELMQKVMMIATWFEDDGLSYITDPIEPYSESFFEDFVDSFMNDSISTEDAIILYQNIFGTIEEDDTYYAVRSVQQYLLGITTVRSFADIQVWMANLEGFGYTQAELITYLMDYIAWYSNEFLEGTPDFINSESSIQYQIDYWTNYYDDIMDTIVSYDSEVQGYIDAFDSMYQTTASDYWTALKDGIDLERDVNWFEQELRWNIDSNEVDNLKNILYEIVYYTNNPDPTELAGYEAEYAVFLSNYSDNQYVTDLINDYRPLYIENENYYDDVLSPLLDILDDANSATFDDFINITNEYIMYYENQLNDLEWAEWEITAYEEDLERLYEELEFIEFLYDMFNDPTNYAASETVVNLLLDDVQNMVATMPAGSLELVEELIDFVMMMEYYDGNVSIEELPFTALDIYTFTQDLSAFLKLRADTLDSADLLVIENYILLVITEYVEDMELDASEEAAEIARLNGLVLKYIGFADEGLTEFTNLLDGLTEADIQLVFDAIEIMSQDSANVYQQVIMVAQAIDAIYDPATVDLDIIIDMFLEIYFDMEYETYDPNDLADTQDAWNLYIADLETLIATVAAYDINAMDPVNYPTLIELQQAVMNLEMMFEDPMDILTNPPSAYMYNAMYLDSMISEMFNVDVENSSEIMALADSFITILEITPGDYEALYYEMLGIGSVLMSVDSIETPQDIFAIYQAIKGLGYSNAEIANIVTQGLMTFLYPELSGMNDTSILDVEYADLEAEITDLLDVDLAAIEADVLSEISLISDVDTFEIPGAILAAQELWMAMKDEIAYYAAYDQAYNQYSWETEGFDYDLWFDIQDAVDEENYMYAEEMLMNIYGDSNPYYEIYYAYVEFKDYEAIRISLEEEFIMNYGNLDTSFDTEYMLVDFMYNRASDINWIYMQIADLEMQKQEIYSQIENIENIIWLTGTLDEFLSVPANVTMVEDVMVVLFDQFEAWSNDPNLDVLNDIDLIIKTGPAGLTIADVAVEIQMAGSFFSSFLSTVDATDEALIIDFAVALSASYCDSNYDATQAAVMKVYFETKIEEILPEVLDMPAILGTYLSSFDETKTEEVFTQVVEMFILCPEDPNRDVREEIVIAALIDVAIGDTSLDYEGLISPIYKIIYELETLSGNPPVDPVGDVIDEFVGSIEDIIISAAIVADYDPVNISEPQILVLEEFYEYLEAFLTLFEPFM